ncbi:MAG: hypothetical protein MUE51_13760 [Thermoleophilia bacterium]|nr:hypothetical protein [Thermoleophilia bacterium]
MSARALLVRPCPPYDLRASVWGGGGTRRMNDGLLRIAFRAGGAPALARVRQRADGDLEVAIDAAHPDAAVDRLRFLLATDVDHAPFARRAARDPLLAAVARRTPGLRPARLGTVAQAILEAACGQLVSGGAAARTHRAIVARCAPAHAGLRLPPEAGELGALAPAQMVAAGLAARRAAAVVRMTRDRDPEALHALPGDRAAARIAAERDMGPWSAGVVSLFGLGRYDQGLVGDLGLVRLLSRMRGGAPVEAAETAALLRPYGEWAGLASLWLLALPAARAPAGATPPAARRRASRLT